MIQKETASVQVLESFVSSIGRRKVTIGMDHHRRSPDREKERVSPPFASLVAHNEIGAASSSNSSSSNKQTRKRKLGAAKIDPVDETETSKNVNSKQKKQQPKILNSLPVTTSSSRPQTPSKQKGKVISVLVETCRMGRIDCRHRRRDSNQTNFHVFTHIFHSRH